MRAIRRFTVRTVLPEAISPLGDLALNLRWSWHVPTRDLFESIDAGRWARLGRDPVALLGDTSHAELGALAKDTSFVAKVNKAKADLDEYLTRPRWYQELKGAKPASIAYFSPEYGIAHVLPQYSGGLGILAGDHLKSASDLGVPITGVGLLYKSGYFQQSLSRDGWQQETYPVLDPDGLPLTLLREADGTPAQIAVELPAGRVLRAHVWKADVGRVPLLLMDSDIPDNDEGARGITDRLYGGAGDHRLQQEMLLGIGGIRALRLWSRLSGAAEPEVFHTNEGHAGFLGLERIRELMGQGLTWDEASAAARAGTVFTTHTPVPAGIDRFGRNQIELFLGQSGALSGLPLDRVLALGAESYPDGDGSMFNMAVMGLRLAQRANGVSQLHGDVSRDMFRGLWPGFDAGEIPITSITNGVHAPTWVDHRIFDAGKEHIGEELIGHPDRWAQVADIPATELWAVRRELRSSLVRDARRRMRESWTQRGASPAELGWTEEILDPDVLTIGFARRVPTYKRLTLMLRDPDRLKRLLLHPERPIQLVIAGKSHPADDQGKRLIQQLVKFTDDPQVRHRILFLPNYDIEMAQTLYPGCDVWLNNPLRPLEACGTSGMKAALNGCLNLSILDGWWDEWFDGHNGWAIPTADGVESPDLRDDLEAAGLYDLIEKQVAPRFYDRDPAGVPTRWMEMVAHTLSTLGPKVLATRMVQDYAQTLYLPAGESGSAMTRNNHGQAKDLVRYIDHIRRSWQDIRVKHVESSGIGDSPEVGETLHVRALVALGSVKPEEVQVQLIHGKVRPDDALSDIQTLPLKPSTRSGGNAEYTGDLTLERTGAFGYTVRVLPHHAGMLNPAELGLVANA